MTGTVMCRNCGNAEVATGMVGDGVFVNGTETCYDMADDGLCESCWVEDAAKRERAWLREAMKTTKSDDDGDGDV